MTHSSKGKRKQTTNTGEEKGKKKSHTRGGGGTVKNAKLEKSRRSKKKCGEK